MVKINSIYIFWHEEPLLTKEPKLLFSWKNEGKPIVMFYYNNGYWKTTLFSLIKDVFQWNHIKEEYIGRMEMEVIISDIKYQITNSHVWINILRGNEVISFNEYKNILEKQVLNKNENLLVTWKNISWQQQRNTLESLLRFNFFTDDEYRKDTNNKHRCSLINSDLDWETKWILLDYILWEDFDKNKIDLFKIAYRYWAKQRIEKSTKNIGEIYSYYFDNNAQTSIFEKPEVDFDKAIREKFEYKDIILQIEAIEAKLIELKNENISFLNNNQLVNSLITNELQEIKKVKKEYTNQYDVINKRLIDLKDNFWDIINQVDTEAKKDILERRIALKYISEHKNKIETYFSGDHKKFEVYLNQVLQELVKWVFDFKNIVFDFRRLKLEIVWTEEKKWDGRLKTLRFLSLIGIILFKAKFQKDTRNLWIWFFDAPFYGVDMINSVKAINSISKFINENKINTQLFLFVTKDEKPWKKDSFEEDLKDDENIYFHPYFPEKEYLLSND